MIDQRIVLNQTVLRMGHSSIGNALFIGDLKKVKTTTKKHHAYNLFRSFNVIDGDKNTITCLTF